MKSQKRAFPFALSVLLSLTLLFSFILSPAAGALVVNAATESTIEGGGEETPPPDSSPSTEPPSEPPASTPPSESASSTPDPSSKGPASGVSDPEEDDSELEEEEEEDDSELEDDELLKIMSDPVNLADEGAVTDVNVFLDSRPVTDPGVFVQDNYTFSIVYNWAIPGTANPGDYIEITLPSIFTPGNDATDIIESSGGQVVGSLFLDHTTNKLTLTFLDEVFTNMSDVTGTATVTTQAIFSIQPEERSRDISFPLGSSGDKTIPFQFFEAPSIQKSGVLIDANGNVVSAADAAAGTGMMPVGIRWTIIANLEETYLTNLSISDLLAPRGSMVLKATADGSYGIRVETLNVVDGQINSVRDVIPYSSQSSSINPDAFWTLNGTPSYGTTESFRLLLSSYPYGSQYAYRITYDTEFLIQLPQDQEYTNSASIYANSASAAWSTASYAIGNINFSNNLQKDNGKYVYVPYGNSYVEWTILVNERGTLASGSVVTDEIIAAPSRTDAGHAFTLDSLTNSTIRLYTGGAAQGPNLLDGATFSGNLVDASHLTFTYLGADTDNTYLITTRSYVTNYTYLAVGGLGFYNKATYEGWSSVGHFDQGTGAPGNGLSKTATATMADLQSNQVNWKIDMQPYITPMAAGRVFTDVYGGAQMTMVPGSFVFVPVNASGLEGTPLLEGTDYTLTMTEGIGYGLPMETGFTILLLKDLPQQAYRIKYTTTYALRRDPDTNRLTTTQMSNQFTYLGTQVWTIYTVPFIGQGQLAKSGAYDTATGLFTWTSYANIQGQISGQNITFTDTLTGPQVLEGDIQVYRVTINQTTGELNSGQTQLTEGQDYTVTSKEDGGFTLTFASVATTDIFKIVCTTRPTTGFDYMYYNSIAMADDWLTVYASRGTQNQASQKTGSQVGTTPEATWKLTTNVRQNRVTNMVLVDRTTIGQSYVDGTLRLYDGTLYPNGPSSDAQYMTYGTDYTLELLPGDPAAGYGQQMNISLIGPYQTTSSVIVVMYTTYVDADITYFDSSGAPTVRNTVYFTGDGFDDISKTNPTSGIARMNLTHAGSSSDGKSGYATITKVGQGDAPLAGAVFELYYVTLSGTEKPMGQSTTGANGKLSFTGMKFGSYVLEETRAPGGYTLNDTTGDANANRYAFTISSAHESPATPYTLAIENQALPYTLRLLKRDGETNAPLEGAGFDVIDQDGRVVATLVTGSDGLATAEGLPPGSYNLQEIQVPDGYAAPLEEITVTLGPDTADEERVVDFTVDNTPGYAIRVLKVDATDESILLAGAVFTVTPTDGQPFTIVSGADGIAQTPVLPGGGYRLEETSPRAGYVNRGEVFDITLNADTAGSEHLYTVSIANGRVTPAEEPLPDPATILLQKVDSADATILLAGAEFTLTGTKANGAALTPITLTTGADGRATTSLPVGTYTLTETAAPAGYHLSDAQTTIEVTAQDEGKTLTYAIENEKNIDETVIVTPPGTTDSSSSSSQSSSTTTSQEQSQDEATVALGLGADEGGKGNPSTFANTPLGRHLQKMWVVYLLAGGAAATAAALWVTNRKRVKKDK